MSNTPTKIVTPFGLDSTNIDAYPTDSPDITGLSAPEGFPANYMTTGGDKPRGQLFNRLLFDVTYWVREFLSGRTPRYDAAYQTLLGGYDADATVMGDDGETVYLSTANNNMTNPNSGGAGWKTLSSSANIVSQVDAESGIATAVKNWTAQRVRQAFTAGLVVDNVNKSLTLPTWLGGWIVKIGITASLAADTAETVTFADAFPNSIEGIFTQAKYTGTVAATSVAADIVTLGSIVIRNTDVDTTYPIWWMAIGK